MCTYVHCHNLRMRWELMLIKQLVSTKIGLASGLLVDQRSSNALSISYRLYSNFNPSFLPNTFLRFSGTNRWHGGVLKMKMLLATAIF